MVEVTYMVSNIQLKSCRIMLLILLFLDELVSCLLVSKPFYLCSTSYGLKIFFILSTQIKNKLRVIDTNGTFLKEDRTTMFV